MTLVGVLVLAVLGAAVVLGQHPALDRQVALLVFEGEVSFGVWLASEPFEEIADPEHVVPIALVTAIGFAAFGWWAALATLALALPVLGVGGSELKELFARERPVSEIGNSANAAYPSGHSRFSVFWLFLAVTIAAYVPMRPRARVVVLAAGALGTIVAGLSRVYLRAHWVTDVLGGWAMALAAFAAAALVSFALLGRVHGESQTGLPPRRS